MGTAFKKRTYSVQTTMQLLKILAIGFAAAAVTSLEGQNVPTVSNEEIKYTKEDVAAPLI